MPAPPIEIRTKNSLSWKLSHARAAGDPWQSTSWLPPSITPNASRRTCTQRAALAVVGRPKTNDRQGWSSQAPGLYSFGRIRLAPSDSFRTRPVSELAPSKLRAPRAARVLIGARSLLGADKPAARVAAPPQTEVAPPSKPSSGRRSLRRKGGGMLACAGRASLLKSRRDQPWSHAHINHQAPRSWPGLVLTPCMRLA